MIDIEEPETPCIGIDLGTSYSVVSLYKDTSLKILSLKGQKLTPSKVGSFSSFKRLMTTPDLNLDHGETPMSLSSKLLSFLKKETEFILGTRFSKCVITVPAYFDEVARQATKQAAKFAGLDVLRLLNEPTAAALAYGFSKQGVYAVYDLGGGTFDLSILKVDDGVFQVLATGGDLFLGGDDIDQAISKTLQCSLEEARWMKETVTMNKELLYSLSQPVIQKTLKISSRVIKEAHLALKDLDGVILVGGGTRLYGLYEDLEIFFEQSPYRDLDPDCIVAMGASLHASTLIQKKGALLLDVTPLSLGLETIGNKVDVLIPKNTPIPTHSIQEFTTFVDHQTSIQFRVLQGESADADQCLSLATFYLHDLPPLRAGQLRIQVCFTVDADGILKVQAAYGDNKHTVEIQERKEVKY